MLCGRLNRVICRADKVPSCTRPFKKSAQSFDRSLSSPARTRFAPSPTGYLHLGSLRTAIYSYLYAKRTGGSFVLRIEDTDTKRTVSDAQDRLIEELQWAGLAWDEGPEVGGKHAPYNQSQRGDLYHQRAEQLLSSGHAYRCFCAPGQAAETGNEVETVAAKVGACRQSCSNLDGNTVRARLQEGQRNTIRFLFKGPAKGAAFVWHDQVYGKIQASLDATRNTLQDTILIKSDGSPTYHFANVVDDHAMEVTHVIRGTEWMPSTALHVALYKAFGWQPPAFAHVGLLTDDNNNKLSKRNFDTDVRSFRQKHGLLPSALVNYLVLFGWRLPGKKDTKTIQQLSEEFSLKFSRGNSIVTLDKLWYLQRQHANRVIMAAGESEADMRELKMLAGYLLDELARAPRGSGRTQPGVILKDRTMESYVLGVLSSDPGNYCDPAQYLEKNDFFFRSDPLSSALTTDEAEEVVDVIQQFIDDDETRRDLQLWEDMGGRQGAEYMAEIARTIDAAAAACSNRLTLLIVGLARQKAGNFEGSDDEFKRTKEYSGVAATVYHALRRRLMFTKGAGPSATRVMAVLGYEESRRRLTGHVTPREIT